MIGTPRGTLLFTLCTYLALRPPGSAGKYYPDDVFLDAERRKKEIEEERKQPEREEPTPPEKHHVT
jgi:hypothetical protein